MGRERFSKPRKMRPQFLVLCEGKTEETYVTSLKQHYRIPIKIVSKIVGSGISQRLIDQYKNELGSDPSEIKTFLLYDGDVPGVLDALKSCDGEMLISKPCIEVWFLAHFQKSIQKGISGDECIRKLCSVSGWKHYKKGILDLKQQESLWDNRLNAVAIMGGKEESDESYSTVYRFINVLEETRSS